MNKILLFFISLVIVSCSNDDGESSECEHYAGVFHSDLDGRTYITYLPENIKTEVDQDTFQYFYDKVVNKDEKACFDPIKDGKKK